MMIVEDETQQKEASEPQETMEVCAFDWRLLW